MKSLTQKTKTWHNNTRSRRFGKYSFQIRLKKGFCSILRLTFKLISKSCSNDMTRTENE